MQKGLVLRPNFLYLISTENTATDLFLESIKNAVSTAKEVGYSEMAR